MSAPVTIRAKGHQTSNEPRQDAGLTEDTEITAAGTCRRCRWMPMRRASERGSVSVTLTSGGVSDTLTALSTSLSARRSLNPETQRHPRAENIAIGASKGSSLLDRELVAALQQPGAELTVTVTPLEQPEEPMSGVLFVVGTPIGNPADITLRALDFLQSVDLVIAEDTRNARALMSRHGITQETASFHDHNERDKTPWVLERLAAGDRIALVSDAGMPLISDPGFALVRAAVEAGHLVTPVPGADAVTSALAVSGLASDDFRFLGFPPRKSGDRRRLWPGFLRRPTRRSCSRHHGIIGNGPGYRG